MKRYREVLDPYRRLTQAPASDAALLPRLAARGRRRTRRRLALAGALGVLLLGWFVRPGVEPAPLDRALEGEGAAALGSAVSIAWTGEGVVGGTAAAIEVGWEQGVLSAEVVPGRAELVVRTDELEARVVGTRFEVHRDALGSAVVVQRGEVAVRCVGGEARAVRAGERADCLPVTAAALLGRARALERGSAPPEAILATVDAARGASAVVATELLVVRVNALSRAGRREEALAVVDGALADGALADGGGHRRTDLLRVAASLADSLGGCARAAPYLTALGQPSVCPPARP